MKRQEESPSVEVEIADRLHSAAIHLLRRLRVEDERSGLTSPQLSALSVIVFGGPITVGNLARAEQVRPPTISRLLQEGRVRRVERLAKQIAELPVRQRRALSGAVGVLELLTRPR